jgi:hypothetical protein
MSTQRMPPQRPQQSPPARRFVGRVDEARLWSGGGATAVVAGLIALVGVLVSRWVFTIPVLAPKSDGTYGDAHTTGVVLLAVGCALAATGLLNLLLLGTPRPLAFFGWIIALATVLAVVIPFRTTAPLSAKLATAVIALIVGIAIGTLLTSVASRSVRSQRPDGGYTEPPLDNSVGGDLGY